MSVWIESPYYDGSDGLWLKGNLHAHSTRSDGVYDPQKVIDEYAARGYDFLMLSDHDTLNTNEGLDPRGMVLIPGSEISAGGSHMLHVGARSRVEPCPDRQQVIDAINAEGGLAILCHPNWQEHFNHYTFEQMLDLRDYAGMEIYNGVILRLPGEPRATDKWDRLLAAGRRVWGYGTDDEHRGETDMAQAWTVVRVPQRSGEAVLHALRTGGCYVSTGVVIEQINCFDSVLHVFAPTAQGMAVIGEYGKRLEYKLGNEIYFDVADVTSPYVRVECYGRAAEMAWTQPFVIRGGKADYFRMLTEQKPVLEACDVAAAPKLTGRMDDPAWQPARASTRFLDLKSGDPADVRTTVKCLRSPTELVFGLRCQEPRAGEIKTAVRAHGDPNIWNDDSVEIFIDAAATGRKYLHVMVNAVGYSYAVWMPEGRPGPAVRTAAAKDTDGWGVELAVPLAALGAGSGTAAEWGLHVCRNRKPAKTSYMWAWVGPSNHTAARYGLLAFE